LRVLVNATDGPLSVRAVRRYVGALCRGLAARPDEIELDLVFFTHRGSLVRRFVASLGAARRTRVHWLPLPRAWAERRYRRPRPELLRLARRADLYHETTVDHPALGGEIPYAMTVHGLAPLVRPDLCGEAFVAEKGAWFERALALSDSFIPVSETCRGELLALFGGAEERVRAVPLGVDDAFRPGDRAAARAAVAARLGLAGDYLLYVGGVQRNKNIPRLLETARALRDRGAFTGDLVLAGDVHYSAEELAALVREHSLEGRVRTTGYLEPEDPFLVELYRGASLFLFPSYYEGWTSPPLEAMGCGTPVVASAASSIPETVGDAALLADPDDAEAWIAAATRLLGDADLRAELARRGEARARAFSWDRTVEGTIAAYRAFAGGRASSRPALSLAQRLSTSRVLAL